MKLETAQSLSSAEATKEEIHVAVTNDKMRGEFLILYRDDDCFVQAAGDQEPFFVEYREGTNDSIRQCCQQLTAKDLEVLLLRYLGNNASWNDQYEWGKVPEKPWWKFW